jgi:pimeloyl-ACP methyl ester carboxylesterase
MYNEMYLLPLSYQQSKIKERLSLPLLVVTAGNSFQHFAGVPNLPVEESNKKWMELQREHLLISTESRQVIIKDATHNLVTTGQEEFLKAIREFVESLEK